MVESFLFCFTLEEGCKFIGIVSAVISAILLGISSHAIDVFAGFYENSDWLTSNGGNFYIKFTKICD